MHVIKLQCLFVTSKEKLKISKQKIEDRQKIFKTKEQLVNNKSKRRNYDKHTTKKRYYPVLFIK